MLKKEIASTFLKMAASGDVQAAYDKFVATDFIHHNQYFKGDRQSLLTAMQEASKTHPNKGIDVKFMLEDGERVACYSQVLRADTAAPPIAVVHMFRFKNNQIVEMWDVGQEVSKDSPNENGMF